MLILQALWRSAESDHGFAAHYSKALGKLEEKHIDIGQVLVTQVSFGRMNSLCHIKHPEGEGKCNDNRKTAIKFQGIGPDHFASSTTFRGCLLLSRNGIGDQNIQASSGNVANSVVLVVPMLGETTYGWENDSE